MIDRGGNIYLTDFGVARHAESTTTTLGMAGTPAYMAPEQIRGDPVTASTDVYALGVLFFELLTGQRPFAGAPGAPDPITARPARAVAGCPRGAGPGGAEGAGEEPGGALSKHVGYDERCLRGHAGGCR